MALTIEQEPLYTLNTVGQEVIFTVLDAATVSTYFNVKYVAQVHIDTDSINLATSTAIGTFKTTPNNAGAGIFDFRPIVESFVSPDNLAALGSSYKNAATTAIKTHPLHLVDKYSLNDNILRYLKIRFKVQGSTTATGNSVIIGASADSDQFTLFNGYLKHTDLLNISNGDFGYTFQRYYLNEEVVFGDLPAKYLTNAPLTQYANDTDYGTISFISTEVGTDGILANMKVKYYDSSGTEIGTEDDVPNNVANGGYTTFTYETKNQLIHFGCYPANLRNWGSNFAANLALGTLAYYEVYAENSDGYKITETLRIYLLCPTLKGYEPIRLTWLNQWGVWDYYTFKMKSTKSISTKGSTYQQLAGTWNESVYLPDGYRGGKKAFRVNAMEKISMNTDFVNEAESEWFEELINSPEVYILEGYQQDPNYSSLNTYVTPARLTTSNFTRKTVANDKLIQYTFEVEKSKTLRTQSV
tara:strand:- start:829 stop:2238 length:1410 start_codon:yes stop_codon:yes gene_type:complete